MMTDLAPIPDKPKPKDIWDKADILGKLLVSTFIPIIVAVTGFYINSALQDQAAKQKTAEIAVTILQSRSPQTPELRAWAESVFKQIVQAANQPLPPSAARELQEHALPSGGSAVDLLSEFEGFTSKPVRAFGDVWTIGFGHTKDVGPNTPAITREEARKLLIEDIKEYEEIIKNAVKVTLTPNQKDTLVSFIWNVGPRNFSNSTVLKILNEGKYDQVPDELRRWVVRNGQTPPGLLRRRQMEAELWTKP